jgi:3-hydroxyacyl-[acyl-carrier-protein] dehydratase
MSESEMATELESLDVLKIMEAIPHRYPMLLVDRVKDIVPLEAATGVKNVTINEPFFAGHFPTRPIMPGVLIIEAMAQTAAVLVMSSMGEKAQGKLVYFMSVDKARFRRPVVPGDVLELRVQKEQNRGPVWKFKGEGVVGDTVVAEASFAAMIVDE